METDFNKYTLNLGEMVNFTKTEESKVSSLIDLCLLVNPGLYTVTGNIISYDDYDIDINASVLIPSSDIVQPVNYTFKNNGNESFYLTVTNITSLQPECDVLSYNLSIIMVGTLDDLTEN